MVKDYKQILSGQEIYYRKHLNSDHQKWKTVKTYLIWLFAVLCFCVILVVIQPKKTDIYVTRYGRLADEFKSRGVFVRHEDVVYAPFSGRVTLLVGDNQRVAVGEPILELNGTGGKKVFYSNKAGIVSYTVDGLENNLKPDILEDIKQDYQTFRGKAIKISDGDKVNAGRPLFKIVDNVKLFFLVRAPVDQIFRYSNGDKVWVTFEGITVIGWIKKIYNYQNLFLIDMERFPGEVIDKRWVDATVLTDAHTGVYVPRTAIICKENSTGVYYLYRKKPVFIPVSVVGGNEEMVVITGLERGAEILANPERDLAKYNEFSGN